MDLPQPALTAATASLRHYRGEYAAHAHPHAQLLIGLSGLLELELDGRAACVDASSAVLIPPGVAHAYLAQRPARVLVVDAPAGRVSAQVRHLVRPPLPPQALETLDADRLLAALALQGRRLPRRRLDLAAIDEALDAALHQRWSTARLAQLAHMSAQHFHARFVELTGLAPAAYLRQRRLDAASRLLQRGSTLQAAALRTGYGSASALAYALKRDRGLGARALRGD
jgi:AraC-like DNA-binding protein